MNDQRDTVDVYAETHVLDLRPVTLPAVAREADNLALYDEYARELERVQPADNGVAKAKRTARKRAASKRGR